MTACRYGHSDGAYVLGALSPAERAEFEAHLTECPACTAAVARLAPVPGLLGRADWAALFPEFGGGGGQAGESPPGGRLDRLLAVVAAQRRRRAWTGRWRVALAAIGSALLVAVLTAAPGQLDPAAHEMQPVAGPVPVVARVAMTSTAAGTSVWMRCGYPEGAYEGPPRVFRLVAVGADGSIEQVGSWWAGPGDEVTMTGVTHFTGTDLDRLELRYDQTPLLAYDMP